MFNYEKFSNAPIIVRNLCTNYSSYIIGGAAKYLLDDNCEQCKDWDIVVPLHQWHLAQRLIPKSAYHNTFGGSKIIDHGNYIDVWAADIGFVMENNPNNEFYIVHPSSKFSGILKRGLKK